MQISESRTDTERLTRGIDETRTKLLSEFGEQVQPQLIEQTVERTFESMKDAAVVEYVPLFVYRSAREQLASLVRSGG